MCTHVKVYTHVSTHVCLSHTQMYTQVLMIKHMCVHVYVYTHTCTHIHVHTCVPSEYTQSFPCEHSEVGSIAISEKEIYNL